MSELSRWLKRALVFSDSRLNPRNIDSVGTLSGPFDGIEWRLCPFSPIQQREEPLPTPNEVKCYYLDMADMLMTYNNIFPYGTSFWHMLVDLGIDEYDGRLQQGAVRPLVHKVTGCAICNVKGDSATDGDGKAHRPTIGLVVHPQGPKEDRTLVTVDDVVNFVGRMSLPLTFERWWCVLVTATCTHIELVTGHVDVSLCQVLRSL